MPDREQKIRERAHQIWEAEGRPEGRELEHWHRAADEIAKEASETPTVRVPLAPDAAARPLRDTAANKSKAAR